MKSRRPLLRGLVWFLCFQVALNSLGLSLLLAAEPIVVDGSLTGTTLTPNGFGTVVDISTSTINGKNAYNAFKTFGVGSGQTVNMLLPTGTDNLLNVVRSGQTTVNGVLNSIKAGAIGGNVYFACPNGFVVGASGVVNVGSLTVTTPGQTWLDDLYKDSSFQTSIADGLVADSMSIPIVEGGLISIRGQINAMDAIALYGGRVDIGDAPGGTAGLSAGGSFNSDRVFSRIVNVEGLPTGATGNIRIIATGNDSAIIRVTNGELSAAGNLTLQATAINEVPLKGVSGSGVRVAIAQAETTAEAIVDGNSRLTGGSSVSVFATAETTVKGAEGVVSDGGISPIAGAASLSLSDVTNTATARIGGDTTVSSDGDVTVKAHGLVDVETVADGTVVTPVGAAASLALSFVDQNVTAEITDNAEVRQSGAVSVLADGKTTQATAAKASIKGGSVEEGRESIVGHMVGQIDSLDASQKAVLTNLLAGAATSLGAPTSGPQVAGAVGFSNTGHSVKAGISSTKGVTSSGAVTVKTRSLANVDTLSSGKTNGGSVGVGAAVAISTGSVTNRAELGSAVTTGDHVTVAATGEDMAPQPTEEGGTPVADRDQSFATKAYSGQGASGVGIAGALAIHNLSTETESVLTDGAEVNASGMTVSAENITTHEAVADGKNEDGAVASVGVGASVALNFAENTTHAELEDGSEARISGDLTLSANSSNTTKTKAVSGAAGGVAVVPVLALTNTKDIAKVHISSGSGIVQTGGALNLSSVHRHTNDTAAEGTASGGSTAVGLAAAVALTDDSNSAAICRNVNAGSVTLNAESDVAITSQSVASAAGAAADEEQTLSQKLAAFFGAKSQVKGEDPDPEGKTQTDAETSEGGVSIAAAVGVTDADSVNEARIGKGVHVTSSGDVRIAAASQLDVAAEGDGSAAGDTAAIGAGVAVNVARQDGRAVIEEGARVSGSNLTLTSGPSEGGYCTSTFEARANAGAGGGGVSVSGAAAINVVDNTLEARADGILDVGGQIDITSNNSSRSVAQAGAVGEGKTAGIGASFASNRTVHKSLAVLGGTSTMVQRAGVNVSAFNYSTQTTDAVAGNASAGGDTSKMALDAAVALTSDQNETRALIEGGAALATDALSVTAESRSTNQTNAGGNASGNVAVGACVAVGTNSAVTEAGVTRDIDAQGDVALSARSESDDRVQAEASAKGAKADRYNGDDSSASGKNLKKAKTGKGGIAVAAAVGVNSLSNKTLAGIAGGARITTTGNTEVSASETSRYETVGSGAAVAEGAAGVGVGVAIAELDKEASATVGTGTVLNAGGTLTVSAEAKRNADTASDDLLAARAEAGAGAKNIGVAGSLALVNASNTTRAAIEGGTVTAGDTRVSATDTERLAASSGSFAESSGYLKGTAIGASFALVNASSTTQAMVGGQLTTGDLTVQAIRNRVGAETPALDGLEDLSAADREAHRKAANHFTEATAGGEANGSLSLAGAFAVTTVSETTEATVADFTVLESSGSTSIQAENHSRTRTFAGAMGESNGVGVGVSSATSVMDATTRASVGTGAQVASAKSLSMEATLDNDLAARAVSSGKALKAGASGAVVVNSLSNQTQAGIGSLATVRAGENLDARAVDISSVTGVAGSEAAGLNVGVGGSVLVNTLLSQTTVNVEKGASLEALGSGTDRQVETGDKTGGADETLASKGIAFVAKVFQKVKGLVASGAGGGSAALAGSSSTTVAKTRTAVLVADGVTTTGAMASAEGADFRMAAMDTTDLTMVAGSASAGGKGAVGAGADVAVFAKETSVTVGTDERPDAESAAVLQVGGSLDMAAASHDILDTHASGFSVAGTAGIAGTVAVTTMKNKVTASTGKGVTLAAGEHLGISALEDAEVTHFAGSAAGGGVAGVGASVSVMKLVNTTSATTGTGNHLDAAKTFSIDSDTRESLHSVTAAGALGGMVGVAGAVSVKTVESVTTARLGNNSRVNDTAKGLQQDVHISALHDLTVEGRGGSAAGGGTVGVGASADISTVRTTTKAEVGSGATVKAGRNITMDAESKKDLSSVTVAAAGGSATGISGATSLIFVGEALDGDAQTAIGNGATSSSLDSQLAGNQVGDEVDNDESKAALGETTGIRVSGELNASSAQLVTQAATESDVTLAAGGNLSVDALDQTHVSITSGAVAGGTVGVGGGVGVAKVRNNTLALTGERNTLSAGFDLNVSAMARDLAGKISEVRAYAGSAGLVGIGAAVAWLDEANVTKAEMGEDTCVDNAGNLTISAEEVRTLNTTATGASVGGAAVGASLARTQRNSEVTARLGSGSQVGQGDGGTVGSMTVLARFGGKATSVSIAGAGGVVAAVGTKSETFVTSTVTAEAAANSRSKVTGDALILAGSDAIASSEAIGIVGGVAAAGATHANTVVTGTTKARLASGATVDAGGNARVTADTLVDAGAINTGGLGGLLGVGGAYTGTKVTTTTLAEVDNSAQLVAANDATVEALSDITAAGKGTLTSGGGITENQVTVDVDVTANTDVRVGRDAVVDADTVNLTANTVKLVAIGDAFSQTIAASSVSRATSDVDVTSHANVTVEQGATVNGDQSVTIRALQQGMAVESSAVSKIDAGVTGSLYSDATGTANVHANVNLASGARVETSALDVQTQSTLLNDNYKKKAETQAKTVVKFITTTIKTISSVVSKIPFVGKLVKKVVKWITKTIEKVLNSETEAKTHGTRSHGSSILLNADVHLLGTANPELVIAEDGSVEKATATTVTTDAGGNLVMGDIINDKIGKVKLSATDGTVTGNGTIYLKNTYDSVHVTNKSSKNLHVGNIQVSGVATGDPNVEVIATNTHDFTIKPASETGCSVSIGSENGGDLLMTGLIDNEYGSVTITADTGNILATGDGEARATNLTLKAGGDIGTRDSAVLAVMRAGEVTAEAGGNLNMAVTRNLGAATLIDGTYVLDGKTSLNRIAAGDDLSVALGDGSTETVGVTVTHQTQAIEKPADMTEDEWNDVPEEDKTISWDEYAYTETTHDATASYEIGAIEGGGDVTVNANNHADFTADRIASGSGSVTVNIPNGSYAVDQVEAQNGTATLNVRDAISDGRADAAWNVKANSFVLTSGTAGIGEADALEVVQTGLNGVFSAQSVGDIHIVATENDLAFGQVATAGNIQVAGKGALLDANGDDVNLTSGEIVLTSETGSVNLDVNSDRLTLTAATGIDVEETEGNLNLTQAVTSIGTVRLVAADNLVDIDADEAVDVSGSRAELVAKNGNIGTNTQKIRIATSQGAMKAPGNIHVTADGNLALDGVTASDLVDLTVAGSITDTNDEVVNISATRVVLSAGGGVDTDIDAGSVKLMATGTVNLEETDGDLTLESVATAGDVTLKARNGDLVGQNESVDVTGAGVILSASGSIGASANVLNVNSHGIVNLSAGESIYLEETEGALQAGSMSAGNITKLKAASLANDGNSETRITSGSLVVETKGDVDTDTQVETVEIHVASVGDVTLKEADGLVVDRITLADGNADIEAGGSIAGGSGPVHLTARDMQVVSRNGAIGSLEGRLSVDSTGAVTLAARKGLYVAEGDTLTLSSVKSADGSADILVRDGDLAVITASAGNALQVKAENGDLDVLQGAASSVRLDASGDIVLGQVEGRETLAASSGGDMAATTLISPEMSLAVASEGGSVAVADAVTRKALIRGGIVAFTARNDGGEGALILDVETAGGQASQWVDLNLKSDPGVVISNLQAERADIEVASDDLFLASARILKRGDIRNAYNHVIVDNENLTPQACTLQLYTEDKRFSAHLMKAFDVATDARAVHYDDNFITNDFSTENSMVRQVEKELAQASAPEPRKEKAPDQLPMGPVASAMPTMTAPLSMPLDTPPVSLGNQALGMDETFDVVAP
ncbi:leukotoxin LktA family filamentous adhesin [Desulfoluna limicola]|nr:leukotoxin LktA family filamentous adhesin [Desulfoluna limicola]